MTNKIYSAAVIGCGSIGGLKPDKYDSPGGKNILTHCHALQQHDRTALVAVCDSDEEKANQAREKWGCSAFLSTDDLFTCYKPDIVVVATPTETHAGVLMDVLGHGPGIVIAEKPFCSNYKEAKVVVDTYERAEVPIAVNYVRRYVAEIQILQMAIANGVWGEIYHCQVNYDRGLMRDGSHAIDLCRWFFGEFEYGSVIPEFTEGWAMHKSPPITDFSTEDPTYAAHMAFDKCPHVFFCPSDGRKFGLFEIHIMTEKGRVSLVDNSGTMAIAHPVLEPTYGDYYSLPSSNRFFKTHLHTAMMELVDNVVDNLDNERLLLCSGLDALIVHQIYEEVVK